jgi:transcriptional regulator
VHEFDRYRAPDEQAMIDLVRTHPFATVVVERPGQTPEATHTPVVLDPAATRLRGATLLGHIARVNREWRMLEQAGRALLVFTGPHGYVSPTTYRTERSVPTWDYAAVHLEATVGVVHDDEANLRIVDDTVDALEALTEAPWNPAESRTVFRSIVGGVVGFRFRVTGAAAVFKLSQDKPVAVWQRVRDEAERRDRSESPLARLMDRVGCGESA